MAWDHLTLTGTLDLTALTAGGFGVDVIWGGPTFENTFYGQMEFLSATAINGFDAQDFQVLVNGSLLGVNSGFSVQQIGNALFLVGPPVPEPNSLLLMLGLGCLRLVRRPSRKV